MDNYINKKQLEDLPKDVQRALEDVKYELDKIRKILKDVNLTMPSLPNINKEYWWEGLIE